MKKLIIVAVILLVFCATAVSAMDLTGTTWQTSDGMTITFGGCQARNCDNISLSGDYIELDDNYIPGVAWSTCITVDGETCIGAIINNTTLLINGHTLTPINIRAIRK